MFRHLMLKKNQSLLQNVDLALELLYHKRNSLIATLYNLKFLFSAKIWFMKT